MTGEIYPPASRQQHPRTLVTDTWRAKHSDQANKLDAARKESPEANTMLIIPAAQHPLIDGMWPGKEFTQRLTGALFQYKSVTDSGGKAEFFLTGNRHHDKASGQTDKVALYDAAGMWLLQQGVPASDLRGKDWIDQSAELIYNGADEIRVAYFGFVNNSRFRGASYMCSPGQRSRAEIYALAHGFPLDIVTPAALEDGRNGEQFHSGFDLKQMVLRGLTQTIDPYGQLLARQTADRVPADGITGTLPDRLPEYSELPWYSDGA